MSWYVILWNNIWLFGSSRGSTLPLLILGDRDICNSPYIFESVQCFFSFVAQLFVSRGFFSGALCTGSSTLIKEISLLSGFAIFGDQSIYCITSLHLLTQLPFGESDYLLSTLVVFRDPRQNSHGKKVKVMEVWQIFFLFEKGDVQVSWHVGFQGSN